MEANGWEPSLLSKIWANSWTAVSRVRYWGSRKPSKIQHDEIQAAATVMGEGSILFHQVDLKDGLLRPFPPNHASITDAALIIDHNGSGS